MGEMLQVTLRDREPRFPHNIHCPAYHLFSGAEGLFQFKPLRLGELSLHHSLYVMCSDVELPAQKAVLSEGYFPLLKYRNCQEKT